MEIEYLKFNIIINLIKSIRIYIIPLENKQLPTHLKLFHLPQSKVVTI